MNRSNEGIISLRAKNVIETLTNLRHFGSGGRLVSEKTEKKRKRKKKRITVQRY